MRAQAQIRPGPAAAPTQLSAEDQAILESLELLEALELLETWDPNAPRPVPDFEEADGR